AGAFAVLRVRYGTTDSRGWTDVFDFSKNLTSASHRGQIQPNTPRPAHCHACNRSSAPRCPALSHSWIKNGEDAPLFLGESHTRSVTVGGGKIFANRVWRDRGRAPGHLGDWVGRRLGGLHAISVWPSFIHRQ